LSFIFEDWVYGGVGGGGSEVSAGGAGGRQTLCTAEEEVYECSTVVGSGGGCKLNGQNNALI